MIGIGISVAGLIGLIVGEAFYRTPAFNFSLSANGIPAIQSGYESMSSFG